MSCAMEYQQLAPPPVPGVLHQAHHQQQHQQPVQPPHPHIVVAPAHQQQPQQPPPPPLPPTSHNHQVHAPLPPIHDDSTSSRWSQYQHLWRQHHVYVNGRSSVLQRTENLFLWFPGCSSPWRVGSRGCQGFTLFGLKDFVKRRNLINFGLVGTAVVCIRFLDF